MSKKQMVVSISGGETSGYMSYELKKRYGETHEITFIFANTGMENNETLDFVDQCDKAFNLGVVWVEAVVNPEHGKGITHRVTNYKGAFRNEDYKDPNHPFHAHVAKSGIVNANKPQCSDRLKALAIEHFKKRNGLVGAPHAIGIRADEDGRATNARVRRALKRVGIEPQEIRILPPEERMGLLASRVGDHKRISGLECLKDTDELMTDAISEALDSNGIDAVFKRLKDKVFTSEDLTVVENYIGKLNRYNLIYPLCDDFEIDKSDVKGFWSEQDFQLQLEDHEGNCQVCWKKSDKKLHLLAIEHSERFEAFDWLEKTYQHVKPNANGQRRVFFRKNRSAQHILKESGLFDAQTLRLYIGASKVDEGAGCAESCNSYDI